ncbi:MAG: tRNA uridine-5-carboxymethylaminomethyl(34) synthesis GTPase MnmE [Deltaproteobacteria bacterium RIFOXYD12_FULL_50_9]|nr:MAG: tRNA uridine-5-carboxymethylaminomethyl(34) synthesis GTPase MnmE [Deltaproteobacteria bacterium RIFOXYD12_FULL_50_9]
MKSLDHSEVTIAAIATSPGTGGIGIIRISGKEALFILKRLFEPRHSTCLFESHKLYYGHIINPTTLAVIDEVLAVFMSAPQTYTREDVVEIHCHGSYLVLQEVLGLVYECGAAPAAAGEFTKRAFLNGRIDLTRAEAVLEILEAKTREGLRLAVNQLQGRLHERVIAVRAALLHVRAILEVAIDFPDEDVDILKASDLLLEINQAVKAPLTDLIENCDHGKIFKDGISVVILGRPNVGKSSLLNSLLKEERAIVTEIPGTTRDTIEEYLDISGLPVRIIDTAGIRTAEGAVEELGIMRSRQKLASADLVLLMIDGATPVVAADRELYDSVTGKLRLLVVNKMDIAPPDAMVECQKNFPDATIIAISAKTMAGLGDLERAIFAMACGHDLRWDTGFDCVPNQRHRLAFTRALAAVECVMTGISSGLPPDLIAIDLQSALDHLGEVVGETSTSIDELLDLIFTRFCIGK